LAINFLNICSKNIFSQNIFDNEFSSNICNKERKMSKTVVHGVVAHKDDYHGDEFSSSG
jgi:plasmid rolling circle replication initiator protein Rep